MKAILSINKKFMFYSPAELVRVVSNNSNYIKGFELYVNIHKRRELNYLIELVKVCKENNFYFQVHGDSTLNMDEQIRYLKLMESISDTLGYKINVVLHPIVTTSFESSVKNTIEYFDEVLKLVDHNKVIISLENLNDFTYIDRLGINDIIPIGFSRDNLYLTYDIGHDIADNKKVTPIEDYVIERLSNIHVHTVDDFYFGGGFDHKPIFPNDYYLNDILSFLIFLKNNDYKDSIVYEYDINACKGYTPKERLISYIKSVDYVSTLIDDYEKDA